MLFRFYEPNAGSITFHTMSGDLLVSRKDGGIEMDFPSNTCHPTAVTPLMAEVLGTTPAEAYLDRDLLLVYDDEQVVRDMAPDFAKMGELEGLGVGVTAPAAPGGGFDCVSRFFAPKLGVDEDPVTGTFFHQKSSCISAETVVVYTSARLLLLVRHNLCG